MKATPSEILVVIRAFISIWPRRDLTLTRPLFFMLSLSPSAGFISTYGSPAWLSIWATLLVIDPEWYWNRFLPVVSTKGYSLSGVSAGRVYFTGINCTLPLGNPSL